MVSTKVKRATPLDDVRELAQQIAKAGHYQLTRMRLLRGEDLWQLDYVATYTIPAPQLETNDEHRAWTFVRTLEVSLITDLPSLLQYTDHVQRTLEHHYIRARMSSEPVEAQVVALGSQAGHYLDQHPRC